jgi:adenylate cyclase
VQQVSRELGVRYILKGGVNKGEDKIHITAQLIDTASGHHVWAHRYERDLKDIFAVQNEIAASIVATLGGLQGQITNVLLERTARKRTDNLKAYDLVLRGDELNIRFTKETNAKARKFFEEAIRLDPNYALAYADLAWNYCFAYMLQFGPSPEEDLQKGFELAKKAISLDDADAESHWILGFAYLMKRDHDRSLAAYERARALNPDYADLLADMGYALTCVGRAKEGIALTERAMRLNPFYPDWYLWIIGMAQYTMHRYEDSVSTLKKMTDFPIEPRLYLAASYAQLGRLEEAHTELMEILKLDPGATLKSWGDSQPFKNKVDSEHFFDGLRKAGLPE